MEVCGSTGPLVLPLIVFLSSSSKGTRWYRFPLEGEELATARGIAYFAIFEQLAHVCREAVISFVLPAISHEADPVEPVLTCESWIDRERPSNHSSICGEEGGFSQTGDVNKPLLKRRNRHDSSYTTVRNGSNDFAFRNYGSCSTASIPSNSELNNDNKTNLARRSNSDGNESSTNSAFPRPTSSDGKSTPRHRSLGDDLGVFRVAAAGIVMQYRASRTALDTPGLDREGELRMFPEPPKRERLKRGARWTMDAVSASLRKSRLGCIRAFDMLPSPLRAALTATYSRVTRTLTVARKLVLPSFVLLIIALIFNASKPKLQGGKFRQQLLHEGSQSECRRSSTHNSCPLRRACVSAFGTYTGDTCW